MARCPWCAEELPPEEAAARFCPFCGSDMTQAPPSPVAPPEPAAIFTHSGNRFVLGHGPDYYGIWDRSNPAEPIQRFPRTDQGWQEAWRWFSAWEPAAAPVNADGTLGQPVTSFKSPRPLAPWVIGGLLLSAVMTIVALPFALGELGDLRDALRGGPLTAQELDRLRAKGPNALSLVGSLVSIAVVVLWCVWQHRAHASLRLFANPRLLHYTPGWAVGWWFIPIANLWMPYLAVRELWHASDPVPPVRSTPSGPWLLRLWWITFMVITWTAVFVMFGAVIASDAGAAGFRSVPGQAISALIADPGVQTLMVVITIVTTISYVVAAILAARIVREVQQRLDAQMAREREPPPTG